LLDEEDRGAERRGEQATECPRPENRPPVAFHGVFSRIGERSAEVRYARPQNSIPSNFWEFQPRGVSRSAGRWFFFAVDCDACPRVWRHQDLTEAVFNERAKPDALLAFRACLADNDLFTCSVAAINSWSVQQRLLQ
jgi:hypothetical protein